MLSVYLSAKSKILRFQEEQSDNFSKRTFVRNKTEFNENITALLIFGWKVNGVSKTLKNVDTVLFFRYYPQKHSLAHCGCQNTYISTTHQYLTHFAVSNAEFLFFVSIRTNIMQAPDPPPLYTHTTTDLRRMP